jgi:hypothetical protein
MPHCGKQQSLIDNAKSDVHHHHKVIHTNLKKMVRNNVEKKLAEIDFSLW